MNIVKLTVQDIMRISAVEIEPSGNVVVIGGNNAQGKTSVLRAIEMALGGGKVAAEQPVRIGAGKGRIEIDLGQIIVERIFNEAGGTKLAVRAKDGAVYQSPQALLDGLVGQLTFDPLAFSRMDGKARQETVKRMVGLDFEALDKRRAELYQKRTAENRLLENAKGQAASLVPPEAPKDEVPDVPALLAELEKRSRANAERQLAFQTIAMMGRSIEGLRNDLASTDRSIAAMERQLADLKELRIRTDQTIIKTDGELAAKKIEFEAMPALDEAEIQAKIKSAKDIQRVLDFYQGAVERKAEADKAVARLAAISKGISDEIDKIDADKTARVAAAEFPVDGLGIGEHGITFGGVPFEQASGAEQLRASIAIGIKLNPKLKVMLVRDGSLLDSNGLALLAEMATEADAQVWVERVSNGPEVSFLIEDGHLASNHSNP